MESNEQQKPSLKSDNYKRIALIIAGICGLIMLFGIFFLGSEFKKIDMQGVKCLNDPLAWAEYRLKQDKGSDHVCQCSIDKNQQFAYIDLPENWTFQNS